MSIAAAGLLLSGCARRDKDVVTFGVGGAPNEIAFWTELAADFSSRTGIRMELLRHPTDTDARRQGLLVPLRSGEPDPDVFLMDVGWVAQFAASDWLEPLDALAEEDRKSVSLRAGRPQGGFVRTGGGIPVIHSRGPRGALGSKQDELLEVGAFFRTVVESVDRHQGKLIALPVYVDGGLLYYRKDLLAKHGVKRPPRTWEELTDQAVRIQRAERASEPSFQGFLWQGAQYEGLVCNFIEFAGAGGGFVPDSAGFRLDLPANVAAVRLMHDLIHVLKISPPETFTEMKEEEVRLRFQQGHALFERNWPYAWALHNAAGSPVKGNVGIAPMPGFRDKGGVATLGGWHIGISRHSDAKAKAFQFLKHVLSYDTQKAFALKLGWNPGRKDLYSDEEVLLRLPHFAELRRVFEAAVPRPGVPYYTLVSEVLQRRLNAALGGELGPEDALKEAEDEIREIVRRYEG